MPFNPGKTSFTVVTGMGDGLGGATNSSNMPTVEKSSETADRPTRENTTRAELGEKGGADRAQATDMETTEIEAQITPKSRNNNTPLIEVIDVAIGKYDSCEEHVDHSQADTSHVSANNVKQLTPSLLAHPLTT